MGNLMRNAFAKTRRDPLRRSGQWKKATGGRAFVTRQFSSRNAPAPFFAGKAMIADIVVYASSRCPARWSALPWLVRYGPYIGNVLVRLLM
jgi:hypothetical protein